MHKVFFLAILGVVLINIIKQIKSEFAPPLSIALSVILLGTIVFDCKSVLNTICFEVLNIPDTDKMFSDLIKILLIGYAGKFICNFCDDYGLKSISDKVDLATRFATISVAIPWIEKLLVNIKLLL